MSKKHIAFLSVFFLFISIPLTPVNAVAKSGAKCTKAGATEVVKEKVYTCIKSGNKLIWDKGAINTSTTSQVSEVEFPKENTACSRIGEKIIGVNGYMKCFWQGGLRGEISEQIFWRYFPITKTSSTKSNNYTTTPAQNANCKNSGDTFNVKGGYLECRWTNGQKLKWIKINNIRKTFINAKSPVSINVCKLQNNASNADRSGRNSGAGVVGFPLINSDKNGMYLDGNNEVLIVPVDFPDFPGNVDPKKQLDYDIKWLKDWYNYFSNGKSVFNVTTIDRWLRMPKARSSYPTDGKSDAADSNGVQGRQGQAFIDEISKEIDLRKFSTVYIYFPDGEYTLNDLIVRNHNFKIKEGEKRLNFFSWGKNLEAQETMKWSYYIHETLHDFNIIGHAPGNGWPFGMMTNQSGISQALNPYEQFLMDWLPAEQIYCDDASKLKTATISLSPVEREDKQTKMAIIKLSSTRAIVIESHGIDKWSSFKFGDREFPPGFYSVMAYVVDLDKAAAPPVNFDGTSLSNVNWAWAVWQNVEGGISTKFPYYPVSFGEDMYSAVAVLGDSFIIDGIRIKFVGTGDFETITISKI